MGQIKRELEGSQAERHRFWVELLQKMGERSDLASSTSPGWGDFHNITSGVSGFTFVFVVSNHALRVELCVDLPKGRPDRQERNKARFDQLLAKKDDIEAAFGGPLDWERLENRFASRIAKRYTTGGIKDEAAWSNVIAEAVDGTIRLEGAIRPHLKQISA